MWELVESQNMYKWLGYDMGLDLCWTSMMNCPRKGWRCCHGYLGLTGQFKGPSFMEAGIGNFMVWKIVLCWLRGNGICLHPGVNLYSQGFGSLFCGNLEHVEEIVWPSVVLSISEVPSLGRVRWCYLRVGVLQGWSQCYLGCVYIVRNNICFSLVI